MLNFGPMGGSPSPPKLQLPTNSRQRTEDDNRRPRGQEESNVLCAQRSGLGSCGDDVDDRRYRREQMHDYDRELENKEAANERGQLGRGPVLSVLGSRRDRRYPARIRIIVGGIAELLASNMGASHSAVGGIEGRRTQRRSDVVVLDIVVDRARRCRLACGHFRERHAGNGVERIFGHARVVARVRRHVVWRGRKEGEVIVPLLLTQDRTYGLPARFAGHPQYEGRRWGRGRDCARCRGPRMRLRRRLGSPLRQGCEVVEIGDVNRAASPADVTVCSNDANSRHYGQAEAWNGDKERCSCVAKEANPEWTSNAGETIEWLEIIEENDEGDVNGRGKERKEHHGQDIIKSPRQNRRLILRTPLFGLGNVHGGGSCNRGQHTD